MSSSDGSYTPVPDDYTFPGLIGEVICYGKKPTSISTPVNLSTSVLWWWSAPQSTGTQLWKYWDDSYNNGAGGGQTAPSGGTTTPPESTIAPSIVSTTLSYTGQFTRGTERPVTINSTIFDCSAWVYFVLLKINPTLANQIGSNTSAIKSYASTHGGYHAIPKIGDIAVWNTHVEFVVNYDGTYVTITKVSHILEAP